MWVSARYHLYGYAQSALGSTNGDEPRIDLAASGQFGTLRFDSEGNLWTMSDTGILRFSASQLAQSGPIGTPALTLHVAGLTTFDFDAAGKLWIGRVSGGDNWIGRFDEDLKHASGDLTAVTSGMPAAGSVLLKMRIPSYPLGIVFDDAGNLFANLDYMSAAGQSTLNRFDKAQLVGTGTLTDPPALSILPQLYNAGIATILRDAQGRILIPGGVQITRYSVQQVTAKGQTAGVVPETSFKPSDATLNPYCLGLDPDGNLWIGGGNNIAVKVAASDVEKTSPAGGAALTVTPVVTIRKPVSNPSPNACSLAFH